MFGLCFCTSFKTCARSNCGSRIIADALWIERPITTVSPYTWKNGITAMPVPFASCRFVNQARHWRMFATSARCESIAPLLTPVVPPVYWRSATSFVRVPPSNGVAGGFEHFAERERSSRRP